MTVARNTMALQRASEEVATGKKADIYADLGPRARVGHENLHVRSEHANL